MQPYDAVSHLWNENVKFCSTKFRKAIKKAPLNSFPFTAMFQIPDIATKTVIFPSVLTSQPFPGVSVAQMEVLWPQPRCASNQEKTQCRKFDRK